MSDLSSCAVVGICGYSGSGKTTLITALLPRLLLMGLKVAVVKHDAHGMSLDRPGKDTERFFQAGATVFAHDRNQFFWRSHKNHPPESDYDILPGIIEQLLTEHDLVLVEGHKNTKLPLKFWLCMDSGEDVPLESQPVRSVLRRNMDRVQIVLDFIVREMEIWQKQRPLMAGILVGGLSRRMGKLKQLLLFGEKTWAEQIAGVLQKTGISGLCLLGSGPVASPLCEHVRLPDAPGFSGPLAGMMAALRWQPEADWLFVACDMPFLSTEFMHWLLSQRQPGRLSVMPRHKGSGFIEPLCAWYDRRSYRYLLQVSAPVHLKNICKVNLPEIPSDYINCCCNFNHSDDLENAGLSAII